MCRATRKLSILDGGEFRAAQGRDGGAGRAIRHRQVDAAAHGRPAGAARCRRRDASRPAPAAPRDDERTAIRRNEIGFVYQFHHLLPEFRRSRTSMMPQMIKRPVQGGSRGAGAPAARLHADRQARRRTGRPNCRAASSSAWRSRAPWPMRRWCCWPTSRPAILIPMTACYVFDALEALVRQSGLAALIATHNHELARRMDRRVTLLGCQDHRLLRLVISG